MKTTKINLRIKTLSVFLFISVFTLFCSCDVLESDADVLEPEVTLKEDQIYVLSNGLAFIDLNTKVTTNTPVKISVTSSTQFGELTDLGMGLFQYLPGVGNKKAQDAFEFTVFSEKNEIIMKDTINIIVENDSTHLPCGIFPTNDYLYGIKKNSSYVVDALANDNICGYDSSDLVMAIYKPDSTFLPAYGVAYISGGKIIYITDNSFEGQDKLIYKVYPQGQPEAAAFGMVYFTGEQNCRTNAVDDSFLVNSDSITSAFYLPVLVNDSLCNALNNYQINVTQTPQFGTLSVSENGFIYDLYDSMITSSFNDFFYYELCIDATCSTARVDIKAAQDSVYNCVFEAYADVMDLSGNDDQLIHLDVLSNDSLCTETTSFTLTQLPHYGSAYTAIVGGNKVIAYERDSITGKNDSLVYKICNTQKCSSAIVSLKLKL